MGLRRRFAMTATLAGFCALTALPPTASASWPMARHDAKRVGATTGAANLTAPTPYWRTYLGGAINGAQLLVADVAGTGNQDVLLTTSGQVIAKDPTDTVLWRTPTRGITSFAGIADVDGDGILDVIAESVDHVFVISVRTGAIEWEEPDGEMGTIGGVRVGDVNGDGKPDVLVVECGYCEVDSGNTGFYWSFGNGFASASHLGTIPVSMFTGGTIDSVTLVKADVSPQYETILANQSQFALLDGSGNILAQTGTLGTWTAQSECTTANIDGVPGDEAVCLLNSSAAPDTNQHRIAVLHYNYLAQPPTLDVLWQSVVAPDAGGNMQWVDPLVDLDGDGSFEVVVSTDDPVKGWQTHIYDALSGTELVTPISGATIQGTVAMESLTGRVILTSNGPLVTGWVFVHSPSATVTAQWTEPNVTVLTSPNPGRASLEQGSAEVLALDLNGDGLADPIVKSVSSSGVTQVVGLSGAGGLVTQMVAYSLPSDVDVLATWVVPPITIATPQVAMARSDGILNVLDDQLQPSSAGVPPAEVDVRIGGYYGSGAAHELYQAPRVVALGSGATESVVVDDSRSALLRLDAAAASWAVAPTRAWQLTHTYGPTVTNGLNGAPTIACLAITEPVTNPPQYRARAVGADGSIGWDTALSGIPLTDLVPGNFNADGVPDVTLQIGSASNADLATLALSGSDGSLLWSTMPVYPGAGGIYFSYVSVGQWAAGAVDDVYYQGTGTFVLSGVDGSQLAVGGTPNAYSIPMLYDTGGSGQDEVVLNAGYWPVTAYSHDLQTALWTSADDDRPYPFGAIAQCPGAPAAVVLVEGSLANPARLKLTPLNGNTLGVFTTVVLAGGQSYPNEAAATATGAFLGQLTAANVHSDLTGQNRPSAVVGSADGWLYGVNPCNGSLDFAVEIGAAVGEAVFGDTDGDGNDEILVTAADGYLYDLKNFAIAAPAYVWDTDPPTITNHDVDTIVTTNKLSATWAPVAGAASYAVQVVTATAQQPVSMPAWQNVGNVTSTSLSGLALQDNTKYLFAVRAIGSNGPSVDAVSNGVTVHFPPGADAGADSGGDAALDASAGGGVDGGPSGAPDGGGCGCSTVESRCGEGWLVALLVLPAVAARRRRRGRACR